MAFSFSALVQIKRCAPCPPLDTFKPQSTGTVNDFGNNLQDSGTSVCSFHLPSVTILL